MSVWIIKNVLGLALLLYGELVNGEFGELKIDLMLIFLQFYDLKISDFIWKFFMAL